MMMMIVMFSILPAKWLQKLIRPYRSLWRIGVELVLFEKIDLACRLSLIHI